MVRLGGEIAVIRQRHEHGVAAHEVDPLEGLRVTRFTACEILQGRTIFSAGNEPAAGNLQRNATFAEINDFETHMGCLRGV